jgi:hypothetical protein
VKLTTLSTTTSAAKVWMPSLGELSISTATFNVTLKVATLYASSFFHLTISQLASGVEAPEGVLVKVRVLSWKCHHRAVELIAEVVFLVSEGMASVWSHPS